jgi:hypothetical protein
MQADLEITSERIEEALTVRSWSWRWVFPARRTHRDGASGCIRRHDLHESAVQQEWRIRLRGEMLMGDDGDRDVGLLTT